MVPYGGNEMKELRIIVVTCPQCDWQMRREGVWHKHQAQEVERLTLRDHMEMAHSDRT
jgi:hypothetical protein